MAGRAAVPAGASCPQQILYFLPLPQGHGEFLATLMTLLAPAALRAVLAWQGAADLHALDGWLTRRPRGRIANDQFVGKKLPRHGFRPTLATWLQMNDPVGGAPGHRGDRLAHGG
jgi:hypothetical protein